MTQQPQQEAVAASFAQHVRTFHHSLPADEQVLLEQVFALAEQAATRDAEVQGFKANKHTPLLHLFPIPGASPVETTSPLSVQDGTSNTVFGDGSVRF